MLVVSGHEECCAGKKLGQLAQFLYRLVKGLQALAFDPPCSRLLLSLATLESIPFGGDLCQGTSADVLLQDSPVYPLATGVVPTAAFSFFPTHYGVVLHICACPTVVAFSVSGWSSSLFSIMISLRLFWFGCTHGVTRLTDNIATPLRPSSPARPSLEVEP
jgi:hypothetical protein